MLQDSELCRRFLSWFREQLALSSSRSRRASRRDQAAAIFGAVQSAEVLEDRTLLTNYLVNTNTDDADDVAGTADGLISLREAINAAVSNAAFGDAPAGSPGGDTITFAASLANATIVIAEGEELVIGDGDLTLDGGSRGIKIDGNGITRLLRITKTDGSAANLVGGLTFTNGFGNLLIEGNGTAMLNDLTVSNTQFNGDGGGILIKGSSYVTASSLTVTGNKSNGNGGGIAVVGTSTLDLTDSTISNNESTGGGGIYNKGAMVTVETSNIRNNVATGSGDNGGGGGIYNAGTMTISDATTIAYNRADEADGGGVLNAGGTFRINDGVITHNHAGRNGGGFENRGGDLRIDTNETSFNSAVVNGGGVHVTGTAQTVLDRGSVNNNTAGEEGGGLWNSATALMKLFDGVQVHDNVASGDAADQGGGGIFNDGSGGSGGRLVLEDIIISRNVANGTAGSGGGILSINGAVTLEETRVLENSAHRAGGGIELVSGVLITTGATIDFNVATGDGSGPGNGGGIHITGRAGQIGRITVIGGSVSNNMATSEGGGLWNQAGNVMVVRGGALIDGNTASGDTASDGGGGIFNNAGRLAIAEASQITNNHADGGLGSGGGILSLSGVVTIEDSTISGNTAVRAGGGIEMVTGTVELHNSHLDGNAALGDGMNAPGNGGGLHVTGVSGQVGYVRIFGGTVNDNKAAKEGGGLWNQAGNVMVVRQGAIVNGNTASGDEADDGGGGIFNNAGRLAIAEASQITNNHADGTRGSGGGIFSTGSSVSLETGTVVSGNTAVRSGGGIEMVFGLMTIIDSTITGNAALGGGAGAPGNGGGIHVSGTSSFPRVDIRNSTIADNTAASQGGGLWQAANSVALVRIGSSVTGNTASGDAAHDGGGGIYNQGGRLLINAASINDNHADGTLGSGGGIFTVNNSTTVENGSVSGNTAVRAGGGVEIINGLFESRNMTLSGNHALGGGSGAPGNGGGIHVTGTSHVRVNLFASRVFLNTAASEGGGLWNQIGSIMVVAAGTRVQTNSAGNGASTDGGAGIFNNGGRLAVEQSLLTGNSATGRGGAILSVGGGLSVDNSTLAFNKATSDGGAIVSNGVLVASNSTIAQNLANSDDVGGGTGGGIFNGGTATLRNTILANVSGTALIPSDIAGNNLSGGSRNSLVSDAGSAGGLTNGTGGHIVGINGVGTRPLFDIVTPLADNDGLTETYALAVGSPAINAGNNAFAKNASGIVFTNDQRGFGYRRIEDTTVDIGAFEVQST